jgi:hypothetical protein
VYLVVISFLYFVLFMYLIVCVCVAFVNSCIRHCDWVGYICRPIVLIGSCSQGLGGIYMSSHSPDR